MSKLELAAKAYRDAIAVVDDLKARRDRQARDFNDTQANLDLAKRDELEREREMIFAGRESP